MTAKPSSPYRLVADNLFKLNRAELRDVAAMAAGLLEALEDQDAAGDPRAPASAPAEKRTLARGHIEHKSINGCGPYAYLRYWSGGHLRSHYMGKVKQEE